MTLIARLAAAFFVVGTFCYGVSAVTGSPVFEQCFWEVVRFTLMIAAVPTGFAAFMALACWLLLSSRSPIPWVRSYWARRLAPTSTAAGRPQVTATSTARCGSTTGGRP